MRRRLNNRTLSNGWIGGGVFVGRIWTCVNNKSLARRGGCEASPPYMRRRILSLDTEIPCEYGTVPLQTFFPQVAPFEVVGDRQVKGTFAARGGFLFISGADLGVCHGGAGVGDRLPEAFAVRLLGEAPLHVGHVGLFDDGLPAVHAPKGEVADCAVDVVEDGVEGDLCHGCLSGVYQIVRLFLLCSCVDPVLVLCCKQEAASREPCAGRLEGTRFVRFSLGQGYY